MKRNMKKGITVLVSALMILGLAACGSSAAQSGQNAGQETPVQNAVSVTDDNTQNEAASTEIQEETAAESMNTDKTEDAADLENGTENGIKPESVAEDDSETGVLSDVDTQELNILVAYFSATNTTKGIAEHIANGLDADLYEIVPMNPYTDADLNYNDNNSRTTIEMNDPSFRPEISGSVENMGQYDVVFIGYPIWWGQAPKIMYTFMESYDFTGKTIVPFCTSGSSGIGSSATNLAQVTSGATWLPGRRFAGNASQSTLMEWVNSLGLSENTKNILIVYFSRWGNTEYPDDVDATTSASIVIDKDTRYGTTEYVAKKIAEKTGGDLHLIETATPYTTDFDELRDVNHNEMRQNYLPVLKESSLDIAGYDTVFIGYPVWATDVPQAVISFLTEYDLSGKTVIPFCTHDGYGAGSSYGTISRASRAKETLDGIAIQSTEVLDSENTIVQWLTSIGIPVSDSGTKNQGEIPFMNTYITISACLLVSGCIAGEG